MSSNSISVDSGSVYSLGRSALEEHWPTFEEILHRLHKEGIFLHPEQLAEFMLVHGLPVNLEYVPAHLQAKALMVNQNYQGDMARLAEDTKPYSWDSSCYF